MRSMGRSGCSGNDTVMLAGSLTSGGSLADFVKLCEFPEQGRGPRGMNATLINEVPLPALSKSALDLLAADADPHYGAFHLLLRLARLPGLVADFGVLSACHARAVLLAAAAALLSFLRHEHSSGAATPRGNSGSKKAARASGERTRAVLFGDISQVRSTNADGARWFIVMTQDLPEG